MLYSPRLRDDQIRALYQLKLKTKRPMTQLLQAAVDAYLRRHRAELAAPQEERSQHESADRR